MRPTLDRLAAPTLYVRMGTPMLDALDRLAAERNTTRSELAREAVEKLLTEAAADQSARAALLRIRADVDALLREAAA